jgi:hypothetical protein
VRLYPAMKSDTIKYPRAANASLDAGMVSVFFGTLAGTAFTLGVRNILVFWAAIAAIGVGGMCFATAKYLAHIKAERPSQ